MTNHKDLAASELHEAKQIKSASTSDAGKVITPSSTTNSTGELRNLTLDEITTAGKKSNLTGWTAHFDSTYTSGSPLAITATTRTQVVIDGLNAATTTAYKSSGDDDYWSTSTNKIIPNALGDFMLVHFSVKASVSGSGAAYLDWELDVGGSDGVIGARTLTIKKGSSATNNIDMEASYYVGSDFLTNGGILYLTPDANTDLWDFGIRLCKLHQEAT